MPDWVFPPTLFGSGSPVLSRPVARVRCDTVSR